MLIVDVPDQQSYLADKIAICQRFATEIVMPIAQVFKVRFSEGLWTTSGTDVQLAPPVMNIFWDHEGPLIAFNRGGAIFCNA